MARTHVAGFAPVVVLLPALNGETAIGAVVDRIPVDRPGILGYDVRVWVVEGESSDATVDCPREHNGDPSPSGRKTASAPQGSHATGVCEWPMERDPVCGMMVDPNRAAAHSEYHGKTYYFCSAGCKASFDRTPAKFAK